MQSIKETASNVAASAKSGMEKNKAVVQEKVNRMTAHNPTEKEMATEKKEEIIHFAERTKLEAQHHNAAHTVGGPGPYSYSTPGASGMHTDGHQISALSGHGTGDPMGRVSEGIIESRPVGTATGTGRPTNTHVGGGTGTGYGTGGAYK